MELTGLTFRQLIEEWRILKHSIGFYGVVELIKPDWESNSGGCRKCGGFSDLYAWTEDEEWTVWKVCCVCGYRKQYPYPFYNNDGAVWLAPSFEAIDIEIVYNADDFLGKWRNENG